MTEVGELARKRVAYERVEQAAERLAVARDAWEDAILNAREQGYTLHEIAHAARLSHEGVRKILLASGQRASRRFRFRR